MTDKKAKVRKVAAQFPQYTAMGETEALMADLGRWLGPTVDVPQGPSPDWLVALGADSHATVARVPDDTFLPGELVRVTLRGTFRTADLMGALQLYRLLQAENADAMREVVQKYAAGEYANPHSSVQSAQVQRVVAALTLLMTATVDR